MQLVTQWLGDIEYQEQDVVSFPEGIPGFENEKAFILIPADEDSLFFYLQSVHNPDVCLLLTTPFLFCADYSVDLHDEELSRLDNPDAIEKIAIFTIVTAAENFKESTTNLMAPIIINTDKKIGLQFIPVTSDYNIKHPLFSQPAVKGEGD